MKNFFLELYRNCSAEEGYLEGLHYIQRMLEKVFVSGCLRKMEGSVFQVVHLIEKNHLFLLI